MKYTHEQIIEKFGEIELSFSSYYKYNFNYSFKSETVAIYGSFGGDANDIYRYDCSPDKTVKVKNYASELMALTVKENDVIVFDYSDY